MPKIAPVAVVSLFEGVGGLACVGTVEDLLVLGLVVRLVVIAGGLAGRGLAAAAVARPCPALRTNSHPILRTAFIFIILFVSLSVAFVDIQEKEKKNRPVYRVAA